MTLYCGLSRCSHDPLQRNITGKEITLYNALVEMYDVPPDYCADPPGRLSALSILYSRYSLYGGSVWACRDLNSPKRRFPARAVDAEHATLAEPFIRCA